MSYPGPPGASSNPSHPSLPPRPPPSKSTTPVTTTSSGFKPAFTPATSSYSATPTSYPTTTSSSSSYPTAPPGYGAAAGPPQPSQYGAQHQPTLTYSFTHATAGARGRGSLNRGGGGPLGRGSFGRGSANYQAQPSYNNYPQQQQPSYSQQQAAYYGVGAGANYPTPPQIRNPFPTPGAAGAGAAPAATDDYDAETAAQIAQWQSAYMPRDALADPMGRGAPTVGGRYGGGGSVLGPTIGPTIGPSAPDAAGVFGPVDPTGAVTGPTLPDENNNNSNNTKKATVYREGGGKKWSDETLLEWDPSHLRLFVGNLAGEVTDESLLKAFVRWGSVQKAKVIRDKRTSKSKGYGFVSFSDPDDFFQAAKEMNGKYIQSHPVVVHKAKTEIKPQPVKDERHNRGKNNNNNHNNKKAGGGRNKSGSGGRAGSVGYEAHLGPSGGGVTKPGQRTKGGLKLLG